VARTITARCCAAFASCRTSRCKFSSAEFEAVAALRRRRI
jgi:hypothetical protein